MNFMCVGIMQLDTVALACKVMSAFCWMKRTDITSGLKPTLADFEWGHPKIDLTFEKILHPLTLQTGSSVALKHCHGGKAYLVLRFCWESAWSCLNV